MFVNTFIIVFILTICDTVKPENNLIDSNNKLALNLLNVFPSDVNNFYSPLSITSALLMLLNGANGISESELNSVLNIGENSKLDDIDTNMKNLLESIVQKNKSDVIIRLANLILVSNDYKLLDNYENNMRNNFNASVDSVNFKTNSTKIKEEINDWVKEQTNGKIDKLFDDLSSDTALVLANAIYFNGFWKERFNPKFTVEDNFFNNGSDNPTKVKTMKITKNFKYISYPKLNASLIELPFSGNTNISMIILLPDMRNGLNNMTDKLSLDTLNQGIAELRGEYTSKISLSLPKFKLRTEYSLNEPLKQLGMKTLFSGNADLSRITGHNNLRVSKAIHKAFIEVKEEGAEAAAVTGIVAAVVSAIRIKTVNIDRPFLFLIQDNISGLILFLGQVRDIRD